MSSLSTVRLVELPSDAAAFAQRLVGQFVWSPPRSGPFFDFESLELRPDGTYVARVEATLVNSAVRSFGARHTLPEEGEWSVYEVSGQIRLRIRPTTSRARVYVPALADGLVSLSRRGSTATLVTRGAAAEPTPGEPTLPVRAHDAALASGGSR